MMQEDWIAVKIGDVNGNAQVNANTTNAEFRSGKQLSFTLNAEQSSEGIDVAVTSSNFESIAGYQYTMEIAGLSYAGVTSGVLEMTDSNVGVIGEERLTMSWNTNQSQSAGPNEVLKSNVKFGRVLMSLGP